MLIVNADDLGRDCSATDTTLSCFANGRISSTSAMVFMLDSERAARLALASGIDVGLHINLSEPFTAPNIQTELRSQHVAICRFLKLSKYALLLYHPVLRDAFRNVFDSQYREFIRLYGREPSHFDGHQHMHLSSNILFQRLIPTGAKVRRSFSFQPGEKNFLNRWYRAAVDRSLQARHRLTDYFFSLAHYLDMERLERIFILAVEKNVELMTHPKIPGEFRFLMSAPYAKALEDVQLGGFSALR